MEHDWEKIFGQRIREMRQLRGWTQDELAREMSDAGHQMHQTTVAKLESGTRPTSVAEVGALATLLEVPIGSLFGAADEMEKRAELKALEYRLRSLTAEASRITEQMDEMLERSTQVKFDLGRTKQEFEKAEKAFEAEFGKGSK